MSRELTPRSNLEALRKEAKRWLKSLQVGDPAATARYAAAGPAPHDPPTLRTVQHALAREHGQPSWAALRLLLEDRARTHAERVRLFLDRSALRYLVAPGTARWNTHEPYRPARGEHAARLLARHPEIARDSVHTAVVAGDLATVARFLAADAALANAPGGPDGWTPLLRLAFTRLPTAAAAEHAVAIARLLLAHGASPHASWSDGANDFTVLTGVIGGGEGAQPAHPQAEALARLLLEHGVEPCDGQALYNDSLGADRTDWLELLWAESERRGTTARWRAPNQSLIGPPLDYLLGNAVPRQTRRAAWLLAHGARGDAHHAYSKEPLAKLAAVHGDAELVALLTAHGAEPPRLTPAEEFARAARKGDLGALRDLAAQHPAFARDPRSMFAAIAAQRADSVALLLDLGASPEAGDLRDFRPLHAAAQHGATEIAALLIARGAEVDAVETSYRATPLLHANYHGHTATAELLARHSRDVRGLCRAGATARLCDLLAQEPGLARRPARGEPPLFALPDDDERAAEVAEVLLAAGADPAATDAEGRTPAQAARQRGLDDTAALLDRDEADA